MPQPTPENINTLNNDLLLLNRALNKACHSGAFDLKEASLINTSLENFANLLLALANNNLS